MGALTVGVSLGCVAGISASIAAAKLLPVPSDAVNYWYQVIYYAVFFSATAWAFVRGIARGAVELLYGAALATALIPLATLLSLLIPAWGWNQPGYALMIDVVASAGAVILAFLGRKTSERIRRAPCDSIWYESGKTRASRFAPAN